MADLRPYYPLFPSDGQINNSEGVTPDEWENCTFEALRETLRAYHYQNLPDDERMREMVDPGSHGGESWGATQTLAAKLAADLVTSWEYPSDIVAAIRGYLAQGYVVHVGFSCDTNAWVPPQGAVVASHAEVALWDDGSSLGFRNVWPHPNYSMPYAQVRSLYDGAGILVFKRSLVPEDDLLGVNIAELKTELVRITARAALGRVDQGLLDQYVAAISDDLSNLNQVLGGIWDSPEAQNYQRKLGEAVAAQT